MTTRTAPKFLDSNHVLLDGNSPARAVDIPALREHLKYNHGLLLMGAENVALLLTTHTHLHEGN